MRTYLKMEYTMTKKINILSIALIGLLYSTHSFAEIEIDKKKHLAVSYGLGLATTYYFKDPVYGFSSCLAVGLAKEIYDEIDYNGFDEKDLAYDALGCALGTLTMKGLEFTFTHNSAAISYNYHF